MNLLVLFLICFYSPLVSTSDVYEDALRSGDVIFTGLILPIHHRFKSELLKERFDFLNRKLIFTGEIRRSDSLAFQTYGLAHFGLVNNFGVVIEPLLKIGNSNEWPYVVWKKGITAHYSRAYLYYQNKGLLTYIGRNRIAMNLGALMADEDTPFDHFLLRYSGKNFQGFYFLGEFDQQEAEDSSVYHIQGKIYRRFVVGHGLEFRFKNTTFGFNEVALFYNGSNSVDFFHLNPIALYYFSLFDLRQWTKESEQNIFWVLFLNHFSKKFSFHGELVIDDYQYEPSSVYIPNKLAWSIKIVVNNPVFPPSILSAEYSGVNRWTYNHRATLIRWVNRREIMGKFSENDMDSIEVRFKKHFSKFSFDMFGGFKRKGPGSVFESEDFFPNYPRSSFINNTVSSRTFFGFGMQFYSKAYCVSSLLSYSRIKDYEENRISKDLFISLGVLFSPQKFVF